MENSLEKIKIGVSSCLLGEKVRWNGDHKQDLYVREVLGKFFEYVPVCPEMEVGMGVPRETVHLTGNTESPRLVGTKTGKDWTRKMVRYSAGKIKEFSRYGLSGFIFKRSSPSCGINRIPVFSEAGPGKSKPGAGIFAKAFIDRLPLIPVEEEGRLNDFKIRENYIVRVFSFHRFQSLVREGFSRGALVKFHTRHKFLVLAHSKKHYDALERLVGNPKKSGLGELKSSYGKLFMEAFTFKSTAKKNVDVLLHMMGILKDFLTKEEKQNILASIEDFRKEWVPLIVPVTLIHSQVKKYRIAYLTDQVYLNPHPRELMLRNHV